MPIPKELYCDALPTYSVPEEFDYDDLSSSVVQHLRKLQFPILLELRTKRHDGHSVVDMDFKQSAIDRVRADLHEAGYNSEVLSRSNCIGNNEYVHYQVIRITKPLKENKPSVYSKA
jgi:hypothetical protein